MIIFGVLASIIFHEFTAISPGGIIVPGYIALLLDEPWRVALTIGLSLLTWGVVRLLAEHVILFGKRRFAVFIIVSFLLRWAFGLVSAESELPVSAALVIGYLAQDYGFGPALVYISAVALIGALSYILLVGDVKRVG